MEENTCAPEVQQDTHDENHFAKELGDFINHIDSLVITLPLTLEVIKRTQHETLQKFQQFAKERFTRKRVGDEEILELDSGTALEEITRLHRQSSSAALADKVVPRSFLVSLISQYDAFLGRLIKVLFHLRPERLNNSEKNLTFAQLLEFGSIEKAREYIMEKEIETVLRKSHDEQFTWLENQFNIKLREGLPVWPKFIEVTERRNLFVHTRGIVSSQYLNVCSAHKVKFETCPELGKEIEFTPEYFREAYNVVFEIGVKLTHVFWRKFQPEDRQAADENLNSIAYDLLYEENYEQAKVILKFATETLKTHAAEAFRKILVMNKAQAYKWSGDNDTALKILDTEDWSAASGNFKLAEAVLRDDFPRAKTIMLMIGPNREGLGKAQYKHWPIFKEFRKTQEFLETFEKMFGEPFHEMSTDEIPSLEEAGEVAEESTDVP